MRSWGKCHEGLQILKYINNKTCFRVYTVLSYDVASGSEITPCNKICKTLFLHRYLFV